MGTTKNAGKSKALKPVSPKKARKPPSMRDKLKLRKEKPVPTISCRGFCVTPMALEAYEYTISSLKNGFLNEFRKYTKGEVQSDELTNANFVGLKIKWSDEIGNEPMLDPDGFARVWIIRYPLEGESTPETRQEGLRVLRDFFMSKKATNYPPTTITVVDHTIGDDDDGVLENYFMDSDIEEIVKVSCDVDEINDQFYDNFPDFAKKIYSEKEPSAFAKDMLGFPSTLDD